MHDPVFPNGCAVCEVDIDPETGALAITRYGSVDDVGCCINPLIVDGQIYGGLTQGVGTALYEEMLFDAAGQPLAAADGQQGYNSSVGDSVYYGDCVHRKGIFGGGNCLLPLQVTTVIYGLHSNATLGPQSNALIRGVPAVVYDEGRSIELYSGRVAIDIFSDTFAHAHKAALELRPLNAPDSATGKLPPPVFCPGLSGAMNSELSHVMASLPGHACQRAAAAEAEAKRLSSTT